MIERLVREVYGDGARIVERRRALYVSTAPVEELVVEAEGHRVRLAAKRAAAREIAAYRGALARLRLGTPAFVGARGDLLLLEWVEGIPLWQSGDIADWEAAARWLAALHSAPVGSLPPAALRVETTVLLDRLPAVPIHGEFYPANILLSGGRIRPLDFETFGRGPGVLDVAALTAGDWPGEEPARIEAAYRAALPAHLQPSPEALADARDVIAEQVAA